MTNRMELYKAVRETGLNGFTNKAEKVVSASVETISETPKQKTAAASCSGRTNRCRWNYCSSKYS
ncbi:hypothetical protein F6Y05_35960 [Bacillus megaterium]|nr:hypothetical protein [Priestia megaterium]